MRESIVQCCDKVPLADHPDLLQSLEAFALLPQATGRDNEAEELERPAGEIPAKYRKADPAGVTAIMPSATRSSEATRLGHSHGLS